MTSFVRSALLVLVATVLCSITPTSLFAGGKPEGIDSVAFSPDGARLLMGTISTVRLRNAATGQLLQSFKGIGEEVAVSRDGSRVLMAGGVISPNDNTAKLWDASSGALLRTFAHASSVVAIAFSPDGSRVLTGSMDNTAKLWDASSGVLLRTFEANNYAKTVASSSNGSRVLVGSTDGVSLRDVATGQVLRTFETETPKWTNIDSVAFSSDGAHVIAAGVRTICRSLPPAFGGRYDCWAGPRVADVYVWDAQTGLLARRFLEGNNIMGVAFSSDGTKIAMNTSSGGFELWDAVTTKKVWEANPNADASCLTFSADSTRVLSGSNSGNAQLWNVTTGELVLTINSP